MAHSKYFLIIPVAICLLSTSCDSNMVTKHPKIQQAEALIWTNPSQSLELLWQIPYDSLSYSNQMYWQLEQEHAFSRLGMPTSPDSIMELVIQHYQSCNDEEYLAKAYYVQGSEYFTLDSFYASMIALKETEYRLNYLSDTLPYAGMTYYLEGRIAESDFLYHIAFQAYQQALPYFIANRDTLRIACCYRDMGRTSTKQSDFTTQYYYEQAAQLARELKDTMLLYEVLLQQEGHKTSCDSTLFCTLGKDFILKYQTNRYAALAAEYLLNHDQIEDATFFLDAFAKDTVVSTFSADHYLFTYSLYLYKQQNYSDAYNQLYVAYLNLFADLQTTAKSRTYTISRMYDVEQEHNKNLQLQLDKQHLWIIVLSITGILLIAITIAIGVIRVTRTRAKANRKLAQSKIEQLHIELELKRSNLKQTLQQRIQLTKQLRYSAETVVKELPIWMQHWLEENTFCNDQSWKLFLGDFNDLYGNILSLFKQQYPNLTDRDLQYIALAILGMNVNDICFLLGTTERTIWNRRQFIKQHLGDSKMDLDSWIQCQQHKV